jgi:HlyD family secretion protein
MTLQLPERAVIVETGIVNDTYVEILSGLQEGQIVEVAGTRASGGGNQNFMMVTGPGGGFTGPAGGTAVTMARPGG